MKDTNVFDKQELDVLEFLYDKHINDPEGQVLQFFQVEKALQEKGVSKRNCLTTVLSLARHNFVDLVPPETSSKYQGQPEIIRIRVEAIRILEGEGWLRFRDRERKISDLEEEVAKLTKEQLTQRRTTFIIGGLIGAIVGIGAAALPIAVDRCFPKSPDTIPIKLINFPSARWNSSLDTVELH